MGHYQQHDPQLPDLSSNQSPEPLPQQTTNQEPLNQESMHPESISQKVDSQAAVNQGNSTPSAAPKVTQTEVPGDNYSTTTTAPAASPSSSMHVLILLSIGVLFYLGRSLPWRYLHNRVLNPRRTNQIPCDNCRFFHHRLRVKCVVHPHTAQTKQSIDCCDYWPRNSDKFANCDHGNFSQR